MNRLYLILLFSYIVVDYLWAMPAYFNKLSIVTADNDTVFLTLKGDENCKFAIDEQGYTVLPTANGWYYAEEDKQGKVAVSAYKLTSADKLSLEARSFLKGTRKGIVPMVDNVDKEVIHKSPSAHNSQKMPVIGNRKALIILMQFKDTKYTKKQDDFYRLFNEPGYRDDGAMGSVYDYYLWASYGQLELKSDVLGPYTAQNNMSYYGGNTGMGGNDKNPYTLFTEAINYAIQEVDLSDYDADKDGFVDNVHIVYAGYGEEAGASSNAIWAHEMTFSPITVQGMKIEKYSCSPELRENRGTGISRIGVHCHELGHALGAMDYYDTDYEKGGSYLGTGRWDVMAQGGWNNDGISPAGFNPYVKVYDFGWADAKSLETDAVNTIGESTEPGNIYRIDAGVENDYFLLENRTGMDFHGAEPGKGLLIFHIGPQLESKARTNSINSTFPQQCYVVCASSTYKKPSSSASTYGNINSAGCPFPGTANKREFSDASIPAALTIGGRETGINLTDISWDGNNIKLFYGNNSIEGGTDATETYSWQENFEKMRMPSTWSYEDIAGFGAFTVRTMLSNGDTPQSPAAASGKGYAKYSTLSQNGLGRHHTRGMLKTSKISLASGKYYRISLKVRKYAKLEDASDSLMVYLYDKNGNVVDKSINERINNQDAWMQLTANIPENINEFSLGLECNIDYGSSMFIDDIKVVEHSGADLRSVLSSSAKINPVSQGLHVKVDRDTKVRISSLNGMCLYNRDMNGGSSDTFLLRPGIYIINLGDKIFKFSVN